VLDFRAISVRFPHLREFCLANVDVDKHSFVNWDAPLLERIRLDPCGESSWQQASTWGKRYSSDALRRPIIKPLLDGADRDVEVDYTPLGRFDD